METYGGSFDEPGLLLRQFSTNGVVVGAYGDVLGASNPAQIATAKTTISESTKAAILLDRLNEQKYKHIKDNSEKNAPRAHKTTHSQWNVPSTSLIHTK